MPADLDVAREVVKMRVEVKRVKVLLIRKLIRQISVLKKKKGNESDLEKHHRRAERIVEEISELKAVAPDTVTKAALDKDISFEKVCRNTEASALDRAIARIATHPQFSKRIQNIKDAIKAFKEERMSERKAGKGLKHNTEDLPVQVQTQIECEEDLCLKKFDGDEKQNVKEEEAVKTNDKADVVVDSSSQVSPKTSLETLNNQINQCGKEEKSAMEECSKASVPQEVVRMRKEVKRMRFLVTSKLTEQVAFLKKKIAQESDAIETQEMAAGLLKDIRALRSLHLDDVTMTALQENTQPDSVLQDPQANPTERGIARIITHPRFINKFQKVKETIREERIAAEAKEKRKSLAMQHKSQQDCKKHVKKGGREDEERENGELEVEEQEDEELEEEQEYEELEEEQDEELEEEDEKEEQEDEELEEEHEDEKDKEHEKDENDRDKTNDGDDYCIKKDLEKNKFSNTSVKVNNVDIERSNKHIDPDVVNLPRSSLSKMPSIKTVLVSQNQNVQVKNTKNASAEESGPKENKAAEKPSTPKKRPTETFSQTEDDEESDLSEDEKEEEKEYFDDSTEERFHKQSSQSEESEDDDFFLGKVSKFKKKKRKSSHGKKEDPQDQESTSKPLKHNSSKLESVFCSALSKLGRDKEGNISRRDRRRRPEFQKYKAFPKGGMKSSQYKDRDLDKDRQTGPFEPSTRMTKDAGLKRERPLVAGRGRSQRENHQDSRGISSQPQSIHPSWEASRKRKEQQAQITAFQGKKIKFDIDE